jgi:hypothetical protein
VNKALSFVSTPSWDGLMGEWRVLDLGTINLGLLARAVFHCVLPLPKAHARCPRNNGRACDHRCVDAAFNLQRGWGVGKVGCCSRRGNETWVRQSRVEEVWCVRELAWKALVVTRA